MTRPIRWLHLSDLHYGCAGKELWEQVELEFLRDLELFLDRLGPPDLLLFTGDLAFSGADVEYAAVDAFLDDLCSHLGGSGAAEPLVMSVPGNHDVARPAGRNALTYRILRSFDGTVDDPEVEAIHQELWQQQDASFIAGLFPGYRRWFEQRIRPQLERRAKSVHFSHFPCDFTAVVEPDGAFPLTLVGLNSTWLQYTGGEFDGKLLVAVEQFRAALAPSGERKPYSVFERSEQALLLQHQPPEWLSPKGREIFDESVYRPSRFTACLFGHLHRGNGTLFQSGGGKPRVFLQSPSLFGLEHWGRKNEERAFGYSWGQLTVDGELRLWPRKLERRHDGTPSFGHDPGFHEDPEGVLLRPGERSRSTVAVEQRGGGEERGELREVGSQALELRALDAPSLTAAAPLLTAWWEHVAAEHRRLADHFDERPAELEILEQAWVRLEVRPELDRRAEMLAAKSASKDDVPAGPLTIDKVLALERGKAPWITGRWLLEGEPGSGKTTLLRHLASRLATRERDPSRIPLFVSLPRLLAPAQKLGLTELLADGLDRRVRGLAGFLETAGGEGRLVVLLDGLDEVPPERRDGFEALLRRLLHDWPGCPVVLASRPLGQGDVPAGFPKLRLLALEPRRQREFLEKWFRHGPFDDPEGAAAEAVRYFELRPSLRELAGNPLYLTLLATLWERGLKAPERRVELYDRIFELLLKGDYKKNPVRIEAPKMVREALSHLALGMTRDDLPAEPPEDLDDRLREPELEKLRQRLFTVERWRGSLRSFLDDVYERTQILGPHDGRGLLWRFWHRTFREALTAEKLQALRGAEGEEAVLALVSKLDEEGEGRWAEPFALLAGRLGEDADGFVLRLAEVNGRLGRRALAAAQGLEPETLRKLLERCEGWSDRSEVYLRLPEQFDASAGCLELIDELRGETRDGNDLFFLDQAVLLTGERWPEAAEAVEALRARFFDHVPQPPEELFQWIDTPHDGRVELWREILAGRFQMGSPEDEEDRYGDEGPRHEVVVKSGFHIGAVPVTVAQYAAFDPDHASYFRGKVPDDELASHPVDSVTWYQACAFCRWLSATFPWARGARLPTEEEWEYACRAGTETRYSSGDTEEDLARVGWYSGNSGDRTHRVGEKPANQWELYDVHGNVWEWTLTEWDSEAYEKRRDGFEIDPETVNPAGAASRGGEGVIRGGSYWFAADGARSAFRDWDGPWFRFQVLGFRVLLPRPRACA